MKILILEPDINTQDLYKNQLLEVSNEGDLKFFNSGQDLIEYLQNSLPLTQEHFDLLISEYELPNKKFSEILEAIRNSENTYSNYNFKLSSLPIMIYTKHETKTDMDRLNVDLIDYKAKDVNDSKLSQKILSLVKSWRLKIFDDLEILGIGLDYDFSKVRTGYSVRVKSHSTKILSTSFLIKQQALPYLWLSKDFFEIERSIDELDKLITIYLDWPRQKLERLNWEGHLQDFFNRNPKFIFQNNYSQFWSNPKINYPRSKKSIKPDLVAKPFDSPELGKNWNIVDLKLPVQDFLQQTNFHRTFTAKFFKCLKQIRDYKAFFMDEKNKEIIADVLKFHPRFPKLTLVLGRRNKLLEEQDILYENLNEFNLSDVYLVTYDEILDSNKREVERLMRSKLF